MKHKGRWRFKKAERGGVYLVAPNGDIRARAEYPVKVAVMIDRGQVHTGLVFDHWDGYPQELGIEE